MHDIQVLSMRCISPIRVKGLIQDDYRYSDWLAVRQFQNRGRAVGCGGVVVPNVKEQDRITWEDFIKDH